MSCSAFLAHRASYTNTKIESRQFSAVEIVTPTVMWVRIYYWILVTHTQNVVGNIRKSEQLQPREQITALSSRLGLRLIYIYCIWSRCLKQPCMTPSISVCSAIDLCKMRWRYAKEKKQFDTNGKKLCWIVTMSKLKRRSTGFRFLNIGITSVHGSSSKTLTSLVFFIPVYRMLGCAGLRWDNNRS